MYLFAVRTRVYTSGNNVLEGLRIAGDQEEWIPICAASWNDSWSDDFCHHMALG